MQFIKKQFRITAFPLFQDNYSYIIQGTAINKLVLVDPAIPQIILQFLKSNFPNHLVSHVLYTHKHWDHAGDSQTLKTKLQDMNPLIKLIIGKHDKQSVKGANQFLQQNQTIAINDIQVKTIHVPCHTRGHTIYNLYPNHFISQLIQINSKQSQGRQIYNFDSQYCSFTGDTLFKGGVGNFFEGNAQQMTKNIENMLKNIRSDSDIYCGHEYTLSNLDWARKVQPNNQDIKNMYEQLIRIKQKEGNVCSLPSNIQIQQKINLFVRAVTGNLFWQSIQKNPIKLISILRYMKNNGQHKYQIKQKL